MACGERRARRETIRGQTMEGRYGQGTATAFGRYYRKLVTCIQLMRDNNTIQLHQIYSLELASGDFDLQHTNAQECHEMIKMMLGNGAGENLITCNFKLATTEAFLPIRRQTDTYFTPPTDRLEDPWTALQPFPKTRERFHEQLLLVFAVNIRQRHRARNCHILHESAPGPRAFSPSAAMDPILLDTSRMISFSLDSPIVVG